MEPLFLYIAKSSGLLLMFYFAYYFLLSKETFFNSNRWFLLLGLVTSIVLPFIIFTKIIWVNPTPISTINYTSSNTFKNTINQSFEINWNLIFLILYGLGFLVLVLKFAIDFYHLNRVLKDKKIQQQADFKLVDIADNIALFSYFNYIVYNSSLYTKSELESILEHEKIHSEQNHTCDVLISRFFCILFWFNPIVWLYKQAILQNLEYIADREAAKKLLNKKAYQYTLLKITTHENCVAITNHFYQSLIKKRIVMLNKNQSKKWNSWKYYAIIPALVAFVLLFQIETVAQEKKTNTSVSTKKNNEDVYKITKTTSDQELNEIAEKLRVNHQIKIEVSDIKRNSNNELTAIKVDIQKGTGDDQTIQFESNKPIKSCGIIVETDANGRRTVNIVSNDGFGKYLAFNEDSKKNNPKNTDITSANQPVPPTPPVPPTFPNEPLPIASAPDRSKMPKPPVGPSNANDKIAMKNFQKEMAEFELRMEAFEPDMSAYEKEVDAIMEKRAAIFDKDMEKYDLAMEKFNEDMEKSTEFMQQKYGKDMKQYELHMKEYEKTMKLHEKEIKKKEKLNKRS